MSLGQKTLAVLSLTIVGLIAVLYLAAHVLVMRSFRELEAQQTRTSVDRVRNELFHDGVAGLSATANDYGAWDRMYSFLEKPSSASIAEEFQDGTLQGLRVNSVLVTDAAGHVIFSKAYDFHQHQASPMSPEVERATAADPWVRSVIANSTHASGVLLQPQGPVLIAACAVTTTEHRGPVHGVVVMTRNLDAQALMDLQVVTRTSVSMAVVQDPALSPDFHWARDQFSTDPEALPVQPQDANIIYGYALLRDIHDRPAIILRANEDRRVLHGGLLSLHYFLAALGVISLGFGLAAWLSLHHIGLSRLVRLRSQVLAISHCDGTAKHVEIKGHDEIADLARSINSMLDSVRNTETKLDLLANNIQQIFWVKDAASLKFSYVSSSYSRVWGQPCQTLFEDPESWLRAVHPDDLKTAREILDKQRRGEPGDAEFRIVTPDNRTCWIWHRSFPVRDAQGSIQQFVGILEDITEFKGAEEVLLHSQKQLWDAVVERKLHLQSAANPAAKPSGRS